MSAVGRLVCVLAALFVLSGCARDRDAADWITQAQKAHRQADLLAASGDTDGARDALQIAVDTEPPRGTPKGPARVVRQDLFYRIAVMELEKRQPEAALDFASRGLALGEKNDVFSANLRIMRGQAHEALGHAREAAADYHAALKISEALLDRALGEETK
jgi:predicted negative regulator of RcsB-dependent stress response